MGSATCAGPARCIEEIIDWLPGNDVCACRDGENNNLTWNCGEEGPTHDAAVNRLRARQMRNLAAALLLSHGVPMVLMGDEYGHSKGGNNNTYCHDSPLNWFNWRQARADTGGFARFFRLLARLRCGEAFWLLGLFWLTNHFACACRRDRSELRQRHYAGASIIQWHGMEPGEEGSCQA